MSVSGGPDISEFGLVLLLDTLNPRSYTSGSSTVNDVSANTNSGSLTGVTLTQSPFGFQFGTGSSFVTINNNGALTFTTASQFTLSIWTQFDTSVTSSAENNSACAFSAGSFVGSVGLGFAINRNSIPVSIAYAARPIGGSDFAHYQPISFGTINNPTLVFSGSVVYAYLNGNFVGSIAITTGTTFSTNWSMFTNNGVPGGNNFKPQGKMYYASAYNRALTAQEIQQNFNAQRSRFGV
jgi:hypothetical protein